MPRRSLTAVLHYLRPLLGWSLEAGTCNDRELLARFVHQHDQAAFAALVERHGPLVLGACRRLLRDEHAVEDAFQATFLVLLRRAGSVPWRETMGSWLYQVAYRTAQKARVQAAVRHAHEREAAQMRTTSQPDPPADDLHDVLDDELQRLPAKYRQPIVLCYLQGRSKVEAAQDLGWKEGTVSSRLARAREMLRSRLARRGLALSGAGLVLEPEMLRAAVSPALEAATVRGGAALLASSPALSVAATVLAQDVLRDLVMARLKVMAAMLCAVVVLAGGAGAVAWRTLQQDASEQPLSMRAEPAPAAPAKPLARIDDFGDRLPDGALFRLGPVRFRHGQQIRRLAFLPGGRLLASIADDDTLRLWEVATGKEKQRIAAGIRQHSGVGIEQWLAVSPDGQLMAALCQGNLCLWQTATGKEIRRFEIEEDLIGDNVNVRHFAFAPDSKTVMAVGYQDVFHWDVATGKKIRQWQHKGERTFSFHADSCAFSADGRWLARIDGIFRPPIQLWDVQAGKEVRNWPVAKGTARHLVMSPDGTTVAAVNQTLGIIQVWDTATGKELRQWPIGEEIRCLVMSPDGKTLASVGEERILRLWDWKRGEKLREMANADTTLAFSTDGQLVAAAADQILRLWEVSTGKEVTPVAATSVGACRRAFTADGKWLLTAEGGGLQVRDAATGRTVRHLPGGGDFTVALSPDGKRLARVQGDFVKPEQPAPRLSVQLIEIATGKEVGLYPIPGQPVWWQEALTWSDDGRVLGYQGVEPGLAGKQIMCLWDTVAQQELHSVRDDFATGAANAGIVAIGHRATEQPNSYFKAVVTEAASGKILQRIDVNAYADFAAVDDLRNPQPGRGGFAPRLSPNGRVFAAPDREARIQLWDLASGQKLEAFDVGPRDPFEFSPDGKLLVMHDANLGFCLRSTRTGRVLFRLNHEPRAPVIGCAFSPDGKALATTYDDQTVHVWEVATGQQIHRIHGLNGQANHLEFAPGNARLATNLSDGTVVVWDLTASDEGRTSLPELSPRVLEQWWADLADAHASRAQRALWQLVAGAREAVPFLAGRLQPAAAADPQRLGQWIAALDSQDFAARQKATQEIEALAELAEPALQAVLAGQPSLELRQRVQRLLEKVDDASERKEQLRSLRAVQVLEYAANPSARAILEKLAGGTQGARLTQEAKAALLRLRARG